MGDYVPGGIKQQFGIMHQEADRDIAEARRMGAETKTMLEETQRMNKDTDLALINSFMEGLIEFIETKEQEEKRK